MSRYGTGVRPLNLFNDFLQGQQARQENDAGQQQNALRGMQVQRQQNVNALNADPNATAEQYVRAGDPQTGGALESIQSRQSGDKQAALTHFAQVAQRALAVTDPQQRRMVIHQGIAANPGALAALGGDPRKAAAEMEALPDDELERRMQAVAQYAPPQPIQAFSPGSDLYQGGQKIGSVARDTLPADKLAEDKRHNLATESAATAREADKHSGALTDEAKQLAVERLLSGEKPSSVLGNLGRGAQGASDLREVQNLLATTAKTRGITGGTIVKIMQSTAADGRAVLELGAREGKIAARVQEAQNFAIVAKDASAQVERGNFLPWNRLKQMSETQLSDPKLAKLKAATNSLVNAYAAAVGGGTPTVHDKQQADSMLSSAQSPEAYNAVVDQLILETQQALAAPSQVREKLTGIGSSEAPVIGPSASPSAQSGGWTIKKVK